MVINTTRFGPLELLDEQIIQMVGLPAEIGVTGRFVLLESQTPDASTWLQSVDDDSVALRLVDPTTCVPGYKLPANRQVLELMRTSRSGELRAFLILERSGEYLVVNVDQPVVINKHSRRGVQLRVELPVEIKPQAAASVEFESQWDSAWKGVLAMGRKAGVVQAVA